MSISESNRDEMQAVSQANEKRLLSLLENVPDWVWEVDAQGRYTYSNSAVRNILGYLPEEILGRTLFDYMPEDEALRVGSIFAEIATKQLPFSALENINRHRDGRLVVLETSGNPIVGANGELLGYQGIDRNITERKLTEKALQQSEASVLSILGSTADGILAVDDHGKVLKSNSRFLELWRIPSRLADGGEEAALLNYVLDQLVNPEQFLRDVRRLYATDEVTEDTITFKDDRIFERRSTPLIVEGKISGRVWSFSDITARKQSEKALREDQKRMNAILDTVGDPIFVKDSDLRFVLANRAFYDMLGLDKKSVIGSTLAQNLPADEMRHFFKVDQQVLDTGIPDVREETLTVKDGLTLAIFTRKARFIDDSGKRYVVGAIHDLTARKRVEESHARLARAVEQAVETIVITEPNGTIVYVNPAFEKTTGYTSAEAVGQNPRILKSGKQDAKFYRQMWASLAAGRVWRGHLINQRKDGTLFEEDSTISPLQDAAGKLVNYVAVKRDVTHEAELEDQLRQAQKMEAVGHLAGGVAHDFNNMLQGIIGYAELAREQLPPSHPACEDLDEILKGARRTADLTKQLLAFARKQTIAPKELDLNDAVANMLKMLRHLIGENITLDWLPGTRLWSVKMDLGQIDQLLTNLCVNARDAIAGVGKITIKTVNSTIYASSCVGQADAVPGDYVLCTVNDNGCGMTKEVMEHIFEPFFTTKGVGQGTGLGLATVYGIVKQNGGFINVYSEPDKGTTFRIYLPRSEREAANMVQPPAAAENLSRGNETILLVEDEMGVREIAARTLGRLGYVVLTASAPEMALRMSAGHVGPIHLLLTDVVMPDMSGWDLAVKLAETRPAMKALYISGYSADILAQRGILATDVQFLSKPFSLDALAHKVREVLDFASTQTK